MLEYPHSLGFPCAAGLQDTALGEQLIDTVHPLLEIAAAALEDETLLIVHLTQLVDGDCLDLCHVSSYLLWPRLGRPFVFWSPGWSALTGIRSSSALRISASIPGVRTGPYTLTC